MAKLSITILVTLFLSNLSYGANLSILSDLDDTVKVTNVQNKVEAAYNALFKTDAFEGMPQLYSEMKHYTNGLHLLSASPTFLQVNINRFISKNNLEVASLTLRDLRVDTNKRFYKLAAIRRTLKETGDKLILLGDDVEIDHEVYAQIRAEKPGAIEAIYIHKVTNKELPEGVIGYYTAFDIAIAENKAGRMTTEQVLEVGKKVIYAQKMKEVLPHFVYCPKDKSEFAAVNNEELKQIASAIQNKIIKYCSTPLWLRLD